MAYYAFLDENSVVTEVIKGKDEGQEGIDWEQWYGNFRNQLCKRTSYNTRGGIYYDPTSNEPATDQSKAFRKNYAGIGYVYDAILDAFIPPRPYLSWVLNTQTCYWEPPIPYPTDSNKYTWNETTQSWDIMNEN